jgi:hypothetical protein
MRALAVLLLAAGLMGCAEMREAPPASRIPPGLGVVAADPVPALAADAAAALRDGGASLAGRPGTTARAIGQLEFISAEFARDPRWAPVPTAATAQLRTGWLEWRSALGIRSGASGEAAATALGRAAIALGNNDTRAAAAALDPAVFDPGGAPNLARLAAPGPLPETAIAARLVAQATAAARARALSGPMGALDPDAGRVVMPGGPGSEGLPPLP